MVNKKHNQRFLTNIQLQDLTDVVTEQFGSNLPKVELIDAIQLVMENIPGIETVSTQDIQIIVNQVRYLYNVKTNNQNQIR